MDQVDRRSKIRSDPGSILGLDDPVQQSKFLNHVSNVCLICLQEAENINHLFIHCPFAAEVLGMFLRELSLAWVFPNEFMVLFYALRLFRIPKKWQILWELLCPAICWSFWLERNQMVFKGYAEPALNVYKKAKEIVCFWGLNCKLADEYSVVTTKTELA